MLNKKMKVCALLLVTVASAIGLSGCDKNGKPNENGSNTIETVKTGTVIILSAKNGHVTANKTKGDVNEVITLTVHADEGHTLVSLKHGETELEVKNNTATFKLLQGQNVISAVFSEDAPEAKKGTVIILDTLNGKVVANKDKGVVDEEVTLTITPDANYNLVSLKRGNEDIIVNGNTATFKIKEGDNVISATFGYKQGSVAFDNIQNGKIKADKETANIGETVTLTINPNTNYVLEWVKLDGTELEIKDGEAGKTATFVLKEGQNVITAKFSSLTGNLVFNNADFADATANKTTGNVGEEVTVTIAPKFGFEVKQIKVYCQEYDWEDSNRERTIEVTDNKATFEFLKGENRVVLIKTEKPCVKFMAEDENGNWELVSRELLNNGKVTIPSKNPTKQYYEFVGWSNKSDKYEEFVNSDLKGVNTVYATFKTVQVSVKFGGNEPETRDLIDIVKEYETEKQSGTTIRWCTDASLNDPWDGESIVPALFVKEVATVTFNNGYENVFSTYIDLGQKIKNPSKVVIGDGENKTTLEALEIVEDYMDEKDINYVTETGEPFNFENTISGNTTITVNWNSDGLSSYLTKDVRSNSWYIKSTKFGALGSAPAWSCQGKMTNEDGQLVDVKGVFANTLDIIDTSAEKVIFGEGIQFVTGINSESGNAVKEIVFPKSLKIIDNSFSNYNSLTGVTLNEGLEVLIGSFFKDVAKPDYYTVSTGKNYGFDIAVPSTVTNIAQAPTNLTFTKTEENANTGDFYKGADGRIYLNDAKGKVLISDNDNLNNSTIRVPEGVKGIQVGTYNTYYDYLYLPSSFEFVNYNASIKNYNYFQFSEASDYTASSLRLFDEEHIRAPQKFMTSAGYSISNTVGGFYMVHPASTSINFRMGGGQLIVDKASLPGTLNQYAFVGDPVGGYASRNGGYIGMFNPAISEHIHFKGNALDALQSLFIVFNLPDDLTPAYPIYTLRGIVSNGELSEAFTLNDLVEVIKIQNPEKVEKIDKNLKYDDADKPAAKADTKPAAPKEPNNLILVVDNKEVTIDPEGTWRQKLLDAKYITINFKKAETQTNA